MLNRLRMSLAAAFYSLGRSIAPKPHSLPKETIDLIKSEILGVKPPPRQEVGAHLAKVARGALVD